MKIETQVQPGLDIANVIAVIFVISAFFVAYGEYKANIRREKTDKDREERKYSEERKLSREEYAKELYRDYLKMCMEHPELSTAKYKADDVFESDKYVTFVSIMLSAFDDCVNYIDGNSYDDVIKWQIGIVHENYIKSILHKDLNKKDSSREIYSKKFIDLVDTIFDEREIDNNHRQIR
ncbi:hypothetical protein ACTDI4_15740 [Mesorhizobium sp. PUT5]|uniref:hypothetical protein n=1 Tax=Mesorhizobium sp. PUT5 TaxID=3454629 RepID=UPI003FA42A17